MSESAGGALPPDLMLAHAGSIRALALSILGDEHAAEDVLQETWLRALNKPPPRQDSVGGWLRRVAEGIAISRLRSEGRRRNRETQWVEDRDCSHSSYDATERAEVLRAVVDEVLALDEPYREAVMRRYFEGLPPRKIAEATDSSVATVNSRLQRAQSKLKDKLDRRLSDRCGGMRGALLALVGWPEEAVVAGTAGWFTKAAIGKVAAGIAGAAVVVALALWIVGDRGRAKDPAPLEVASAVEAPRAARELAELAEIDSTSASRVQIVSEPTAARAVVGTPLVAPLPGPFAFDLCIEPIDATGLAVADCNVWVGPAPGPLALVGATGWDGALRLAWRGDEREVVFVVRAARAGSGSTPLRRIRVIAGAERVVRLALDGGRGAMTAQLESGMAANDGTFGRPTTRPKRDDGHFLLDRAGNGVFQDSWLLTGTDAVGVASGHAALELLVPSTPFGVATGWSGEEPGTKGSIEVRVIDSAGRTVANAPVAFRFALGGYTETTGTWPSGIARCPRACGGAALVTVGAPGTQFPLVTVHFDVVENVSRALDVVLPSVSSTAVRLVDEKGAARGGWLYELRDEQGSTLGRGVFDTEGRASVSMPDGVAVRLLARADATGPAVVVASALIARDVEQVLVAAFDSHARSLRVVVRGANGPDSVVRVTRVDSGDALDAAPAESIEPGEEGARVFRVRGLSNGEYHIAVGSPTRGWIDAGLHEITSGRGAEVVRVDLEDPARLEVANGAAERLRVIGYRAGMRIVSPDVRAGDGAKLTAAPGRFELLVERDRSVPTVRPVNLEPGATVRVE